MILTLEHQANDVTDGEDPSEPLPRLAALTFDRSTDDMNRDRVRVARRICHIVLQDPDRYAQHDALAKIRGKIHSETGWDAADISSALNLVPSFGIYVDRMTGSLIVSQGSR